MKRRKIICERNMTIKSYNWYCILYLASVIGIHLGKTFISYVLFAFIHMLINNKKYCMFKSKVN